MGFPGAIDGCTEPSGIVRSLVVEKGERTPKKLQLCEKALYGSTYDSTNGSL